MLENDLIIQNPLKLMGHEPDDIVPEGGFGAVMSRAGVGKTAFMVQIALSTLLRGKKVLHISLNDPVKKVNLWYKEVFNLLAKQYNVKQANQLWEAIISNRFIMTFKVEGFNVPKFKERMTDLTEQDIFSPKMIIVDGLPFDESVRKSLSDLKAYAKDHLMHVWFTIRTHRHEKPGPDGIPAPFFHVADLFEVAIFLQPEGEKIHVKALKGGNVPSDYPPLFLDPSTMLIKE